MSSNKTSIFHQFGGEYYDNDYDDYSDYSNSDSKGKFYASFILYFLLVCVNIFMLWKMSILGAVNKYVIWILFGVYIALFFGTVFCLFTRRKIIAGLLNTTQLITSSSLLYLTNKWGNIYSSDNTMFYLTCASICASYSAGLPTLYFAPQ